MTSYKFWIIFSVVILVLLSVIFTFFPHLIRHPSTYTKNQKIPTVYFSVPTPQNLNIVENQLVQTTGCGAPLTLKIGSSTFMVIKSGKETRRFLVYLPPNYNNLIMHPLVLSFHGYDDTPSDMERFSKLDSLANNAGFIVVYPEGSKALGGQLGWNTGLHPTIRGSDVLFVSNMLNALQTNFCINQKKIYATGFSNGGGFVAELACKMSDRIASFAPVSGSYLTFFDSCNSTRAVSILEIHGSADTIVPYLGLPNLKEIAAYSWVSGWAKRDGCLDKSTQTKESKTVTKYSWEGCQESASVIHYEIIGGRHVWPKPLFVQNINGKVEYGSTAQTIWDFFDQHPMSS